MNNDGPEISKVAQSCKNINPVDSANTNCTTAGILKVRKSRRKFLQTTNDFSPDF